MTGQEPQAWDMPVVRALDDIEQLPGFAPEHVEWHGFRFWASGMDTPMHTASIYAYPAKGDDDAFVRYAVTGNRPSITGQGRCSLGPDDVAEQLDIPVSSAVDAAAALGPALEEALRLYNDAHHPQTASEAAIPSPVVELFDHHTQTHGLPTRGRSL